MDIEVEFRFEVKDMNLVRDFLKSAIFVRKVRQIDVYFDVESGDFYKKGAFIRTRNSTSLDFKFNLDSADNRHEHCNESSFPLPLSKGDLSGLSSVCKILGLQVPGMPDFKAFLELNRLKELFTIDKTRESFVDGPFTICLDDIPGFGKFMEVEVMAKTGDNLDSIKRQIINKVKVLDPHFLSAGYAELLIKKINPELYMQGRFLFSEDKSKA